MATTPKQPKIDLGDDEFGAILNCAVRYALGRRTYMPYLITSYIRPFLPYLTSKTLGCFKRDLEDCHDFGDPEIDEPVWKRFLAEVNKEYNRRYNHEE